MNTLRSLLYRRVTIERHVQTKSSDPRWYRRAGEILASDKRLVADRFPAHGAIRIGRAGDIWVQEYMRPTDGDQGWLVFDANGELECRVSVPFAETWDFFEIGVDYVLGLERDELEVEHVRRYSFSRPPR